MLLTLKLDVSMPVIFSKSGKSQIYNFLADFGLCIS